MAFHFRFEAVLSLRRSQERGERLKLEAIASEEAQIRARIQELADLVIESTRSFQQRLKAGMAGSELQLESVRAQDAIRKRKLLRLRLDECEKRRATQALLYYQARRNRETLEELRLRQLQDYRQAEAKREQRELDDLFLIRRDFRKTE